MSRRRLPRLVAALLTLLLAFALAGCAQQNTSGGSDGKPAEEGPPKQEQAGEQEQKKPEYTSWTVYINDDDSYSAGSVTYKIALNLTATNPTGDIEGTYKGNATASTQTEGTVHGQQLSTQAIANSGALQFKLADESDALAQLDPATWKYSGAGTITMKASGSGTIGAAGGSFSNTSSQKLDVEVNGSKVTLKVNIQGHTYTFDGTISGK